MLCKPIRQAFVLLSVCVSVVLNAQAAYPERPVHIVVPYAAGGGSDIMTRALAKAMAAATGQNFVVENRPGAGGNLGALAVARAARDGYTLLLASPATHGINTFMYKSPGFDPVKDFAAIGMIGNSAMVLFAHVSVPVSNLQELIALVRANPGKYPYASPGSGSQHHLGMEQLKAKARLDMPHVPYKGAGPAMIDLVGGQVPFMIGGFGPAAPYLAQGKIRALAAANSKRLPSASHVPVFAETVPGTGVGSWVGLMAPAGVALDVVRALSGVLEKALKDEELRQSFTRVGVDIEYQPPEAFARLVAADLPVWKELVEVSGAKAD
jgi:tripartite-type tricarboxylate transporter receptor subunit TctC